MQICYTDMLPFEDIPDDTVPVTAYLKVILSRMRQDDIDGLPKGASEDGYKAASSANFP